MKVDGVHHRSIWPHDDGETVGIIDQTLLPFAFATRRLATLDAAAEAIRVMRVRGAPLIGVTAAYGMALAMRDDPDAVERMEAADVPVCSFCPNPANPDLLGSLVCCPAPELYTL